MLRSLKLSLTHNTKCFISPRLFCQQMPYKLSNLNKLCFSIGQLLPVLFCYSAPKLMFPDQGHTSDSFDALISLPQRSCPIPMFILMCNFFSQYVSRRLERARTPSSNQEPFLCTLPSISKHHKTAVTLQDGIFPVLSLSKAVAAGACSVSLNDCSLIVWACRCCVRTDNIQLAQGRKVGKGLTMVTMWLSEDWPKFTWFWNWISLHRRRKSIVVLKAITLSFCTKV